MFFTLTYSFDLHILEHNLHNLRKMFYSRARDEKIFSPLRKQKRRFLSRFCLHYIFFFWTHISSQETFPLMSAYRTFGRERKGENKKEEKEMIRNGRGNSEEKREMEKEEEWWEKRDYMETFKSVQIVISTNFSFHARFFHLSAYLSVSGFCMKTHLTEKHFYPFEDTDLYTFLFLFLLFSTGSGLREREIMEWLKTLFFANVPPRF